VPPGLGTAAVTKTAGNYTKQINEQNISSEIISIITDKQIKQQ
jgi:hypothetical protein